MENFKKVLRSLTNIHSSKYLNLDALYDICGDDLVRFHELSIEARKKEFSNICAKYESNILISPLFDYIPRGNSKPYKVKYDKKKYEELSPSVLDLTHREIFTHVIRYFFEHDVIFLNMDAIYDESEIFFSSLIDLIKNNHFDITKENFISNRIREMNINRQYIRIFTNTDIMFYFITWCNFMMAKITQRNVIFYAASGVREVNAKSGVVCEKFCMHKIPCLMPIEHDFY